MLENFLFIIAPLIILSVIASKASSRFGIPALLLFLLIGIGVGPYGAKELLFSNYQIAQELGILALISILFSGGMDTELKAAMIVVKPALILSTLGVVIATCLVGIFAWYFLHFSLFEGLLLGTTVASTDVVAVFTVLRSKNVRLKEGIGSLLELESALNDPMTVFLGIGLLGLLTQKSESILWLLPLFFQQMVLGASLGFIFGKMTKLTINRAKLEFEGLYPVLSIGWILLAYAITQKIGGSGFLAVYIMGIILGNENLLHKKSLVHFHEGIAWIMQIAMFLTMGLLVDPKELLEVSPIGIAISIFLVLVARPISVFLCLVKSRFAVREKLMISWAGLRGAVPIILATFPLIAQIPRAREIFNLVFFVTFTSVLLQGTLIPLIAKWLKVALPFQEKFRFPIEFNPVRKIKNNLMEVLVAFESTAIGKTLIDLKLPKDVLIVLIQRGEDILVPRGDLKLKGNDNLLILTDGKSLDELKQLLQ